MLSCDLYFLVYSCAYTQPQDVRTALLSATTGRSLATCRCERLAESAHLCCDERTRAHSRISTVGERRVVERTAGRTWPVVIEIGPRQLLGWWS